MHKQSILSLNPIQYMIFDLDGVIVNSEPLHYEAYFRAFEKNGLSLSCENYNAKLRSKGRKEGLSALIDDSNQRLIEEVSKDKDIIFGELLDTETIPLYADAIDLIKVCKKRNIPIAIGTASKMGASVLEKIGIKSLFDVIITSQDVINNKPHSEIYIRCQDALNSDANRTLVIEDSESGIIAALNAQLNVIYIKRNGAPLVGDAYLNHEKVFGCDDLSAITDILKK